jgi:hypothetical protein
MFDCCFIAAIRDLAVALILAVWDGQYDSTGHVFLMSTWWWLMFSERQQARCTR